jgi:stress-induced morphogen
MAAFLTKLQDLLQSSFPDSVVQLEQVPSYVMSLTNAGRESGGPAPALTLPRADNDKVGGFLIWPGFEGYDQVERQRTVWEILRERLSPDEQRRVTAILTITPLEQEGMLGSED